MTYAQGRLIHDADSHLMELDGCLDPWFEPRLLGAFHDLAAYRKKVEPADWANVARRTQDDPGFRAGDAENLLLRKNYQALSSAFRREGQAQGHRPARFRQPVGVHDLLPGQFRPRRRR